MKRAALLLLLAVGSPGALHGQPTDSMAQRFEVDFAIPDAPAFELLQVNESSLLRPTTVRALTAGISNLFQGEDGGLDIPDAFGLETAPFLLARGPTLTLTQYRANPALYRMRFSAAAQRNASTGAATGIAAGIRLSLSDDADLRMNQAYIDSATAFSKAINDILVNARLNTRPPAQPVLTQAQKDSIAMLTEQTKKFVERWAQTRWNADVLDVAAGVMAASADSLGNDLKVGQLAAWGTWGRGVGDWGQLLVGGRGTFGREEPGDERGLGGDLGARFYAGTNAYKVFVEGQSTLASGDVPEWLLNTGGEARLYNRLWANFSAAITWDGGGDAHLTGRFTLKGAAPPLF